MNSALLRILSRASCALLVSLFVAVRAMAAAPIVEDGPYIGQADGAWIARWVTSEDGAEKVRKERVQAGSEITVPAVGSVPAFKVRLRKADGIAPNEVALRAGTPLFVMADTHGEFEIAVDLLKSQHVIDAALRWAFGKGHLAVLGDVFDRGPNQTEILWLLYQLEAEAARAGGGVHLVLGNHESMALGGDDRYLNPKYERVREVLGVSSYALLWNEQTFLGQWLRQKATVLKLGEFLCLHGGISPDVVARKLTIAQINADVRDTLGTRKSDAFIMSTAGPQWYRGYFPDMARDGGYPAATPEDIDRILAFYGVKTVLVGHTIVPTVTELYGGKVVAVQVYPHWDGPNHKPVMEGLLVKQGRFYRARIDGTAEPLAP